MEKARLIKGVGGLYTVKTEDKTVLQCRAKGSFRKEGMRPLPGDFVSVEKQRDGDALITAILPRRNELIRPAGANIDRMILVLAAEKPDPDLFLLDKMTAVAQYNGIRTILLINKTDSNAEKAAYYRDIYQKSGFDVYLYSAHYAADYTETAEKLLYEMQNGVTFFAGASGVGKSSVIASFYPTLSEEMQTGAISEKIGRGKHTTRKTELFPIGENGYIADTPGFSMLEIARFNLIPKDGLLRAFPDIRSLSDGCRYHDCTHTKEEGCRVIEAVEKGILPPSRHESFTVLFDELKNRNDWDT